MAKWPITVCERCSRGAEERVLEVGACDEAVEVIPADLGRELYEALKGAGIGVEYDSVEDEQRQEAALARYEREVGS